MGNASFGKRTKHGFTFVGDQFEGFVEELGLKHRRKRKAHYVATVPPPGEPHHYKNNICVDLVTLPNHLLKALKESTESYNSKVAETNRGEVNKRRAKKVEDEKKAKLKAEATLRAIQFPHTSKMVAPNKEISLANETVAKWVGFFCRRSCICVDLPTRRYLFSPATGRRLRC